MPNLRPLLWTWSPRALIPLGNLPEAEEDRINGVSIHSLDHL
jgi:hypothetical protein